MTASMDWLVFGEDWGVHPSTTQHLIRALPSSDRIVWIDSIGMRTPRFTVADLQRSMQKLRSTFAGHSVAVRDRCPDHLIRPVVLPFHRWSTARRFNAFNIGRRIRRFLQDLDSAQINVLISNPLAVYYLDGVPATRLIYIRLDDYPVLPNIHRQSLEMAERDAMDAADLIVVTAKTLLPSEERHATKSLYLPQGVDFAHFSSVSLETPRQKIIGFAGYFAEWVDYHLARDVARLCPDWTFEFVGPVQYLPRWFRDIPNVRIGSRVPYSSLPSVLSRWKAAWIPFTVSRLTRGVNPLKLREYLAAGLATAATALPEVMSQDGVEIIETADHVKRWLDKIEIQDDLPARRRRRSMMADHDWVVRAATFREAVIAARTARSMNPRRGWLQPTLTALTSRRA